MKRLFLRFQKETDLAYQTWLRINGLHTPPPPPPPKAWYVKLWEFILALFGSKPKRVAEPVIPESISGLSIAFNQWRTTQWNIQCYLKGFRNKGRYPFGDRVTKFEIRKWTEELYSNLKARLITQNDVDTLVNTYGLNPPPQVNDVLITT